MDRWKSIGFIWRLRATMTLRETGEIWLLANRLTALEIWAGLSTANRLSVGGVSERLQRQSISFWILCPPGTRGLPTGSEIRHPRFRTPKPSCVRGRQILASSGFRLFDISFGPDIRWHGTRYPGLLVTRGSNRPITVNCHACVQPAGLSSSLKKAPSESSLSCDQAKSTTCNGILTSNMKTEVEDVASEVCTGAAGQNVTPTTGVGTESTTGTAPMECGGCGDRVQERTVLCVGGRSWHSRCLRCCACARPLHDQHSCFLRGMRLYCRHDYAMAFGAKCAKCGRSVGAGDWVRRARERVYHLACFACDACSRQLSTGEQFALLDARLLCKAHYLDVVEGNNTSSDEGGDSESGHKGGNKAKRVRTTFTEEQLSVLQANFQLDSNPDGQDLERIAHVTGLSKRVTQVWFQNSRARQKKHLHTGKLKGQHVHQSPTNSASPAAGDFGRHINLHLTYSFQHQQHQHNQQPQLSPAACKSPTPSLYHNHGSEQSMDELSQDSMMLSMPINKV